MKLKLAIVVLITCLPCVVNSTVVAETVLSGFKPDIEFAKVGDASLTLDAFVPDGAGPFPTCILVHGGGFVKGDKQSYIKPLFEPLSNAGFAWFTINYRLAPQHRWPACAEDVETAIRWVKSHAKDYKVDVGRIALIGESAGGHLVSWVGTRAKEDTQVAAVVPFYAPHDLELQVKHRNMLGESMTALLGLTELNDDAWKRLREVSPSSYVHKGMPSFLLIHGDKDPTVPFEQSTRFQKQMKDLGNQCELITIPDGVHGMGGWDKLNSDYRAQLVAWLKKTLKAESAGLSIKARRQVKVDDTQDQFRLVEDRAAWEPTKTAIIIVDMWDTHSCRSAAQRVAEMAPHVNRTINAARDKGVFVIHAPSDCMEFYKDTPQRHRAMNTPRAESAIKFQWNYFNADREGTLAEKLEKGGCSCDTPEPCGPSRIVWKRQIETIQIHDADAITADGQEVFNLLQARGIDNVILVGVHTNRCVLGRPFGIRQMAYLHKNVVLCRDLTDSFHRDPGHHFEGLDQIVTHVEKYWCPTITSESLTGQSPFRFAGAKDTAGNGSRWD